MTDTLSNQAELENFMQMVRDKTIVHSSWERRLVAEIDRLRAELQWIADASARYHNADSRFIISGIEQHARSVLEQSATEGK